MDGVYKHFDIRLNEDSLVLVIKDFNEIIFNHFGILQKYKVLNNINQLTEFFKEINTKEFLIRRLVYESNDINDINNPDNMKILVDYLDFTKFNDKDKILSYYTALEINHRLFKSVIDSSKHLIFSYLNCIRSFYNLFSTDKYKITLKINGFDIGLISEYLYFTIMAYDEITGGINDNMVERQIKFSERLDDLFNEYSDLLYLPDEIQVFGTLVFEVTSQEELTHDEISQISNFIVSNTKIFKDISINKSYIITLGSRLNHINVDEFNKHTLSIMFTMETFLKRINQFDE